MKQASPRPKTFGELNFFGKLAFLGKVLVFLATFGFAYPSLFTD